MASEGGGCDPFSPPGMGPVYCMISCLHTIGLRVEACIEKQYGPGIERSP